MGMYQVNFNLSLPLNPDDEYWSSEEDYIRNFEGEIVESEDSDGSGVEKPDGVIGKINGHIIQAGRAESDRIHLFDACDAASQEAVDVYNAVYGRGYEPKKSLDLAGIGTDVLSIDFMGLSPKHRGRGLGLLAMLSAINTFGSGCVAAVILPFPLQMNHDPERPDSDGAFMELGSMSADKSASLRKLRSYYAKLGFRRIAKSDHYFLDLGRVHPTPAQVAAMFKAKVE